MKKSIGRIRIVKREEFVDEEKQKKLCERARKKKEGSQSDGQKAGRREQMVAMRTSIVPFEKESVCISRT